MKDSSDVRGSILEMDMGASFRPAENGEVVASCSSFYILRTDTLSDVTESDGIVS